MTQADDNSTSCQARTLQAAILSINPNIRAYHQRNLTTRFGKKKCKDLLLEIIILISDLIIDATAEALRTARFLSGQGC